MCRIIQTAINDELDYLYRCDGRGYQPNVSDEVVFLLNNLKTKFRKNYKDYLITLEDYQAYILSRYQTDDNMKYHYTEDMPAHQDLSTYHVNNELITEQSADYLIETLEDLNDLAENDYGRLELDHYFFDSGYLGRQWTLTQYMDDRCYQ